MCKVKKLFNSLLLAFVLIGSISGGVFLSVNSPSQSIVSAAADELKLENSAPVFWKTSPTNATVKEDVYLLEQNGKVNMSIANDTNIISVDESEGEKINPAYILENDESGKPLKYYYFNFLSSLSLYHNVSNAELASLNVGSLKNLLEGQQIATYATSNSQPFAVNGMPEFPQKLNIDFALNTAAPSIVFENSTVTLTENGLYTLVVPLMSFYTEDGGKTFSSAQMTITYSFMLFDSSKYFSSISRLPNVEMSSVQTSNLTTSSTHSVYYFYNYSTKNNKLPTFTYDPKLYSFDLTYTDREKNVSMVNVQYDYTAGKVILKQNGLQVENIDFLYITNKDGNVILSFNNLGQYDFNFNFLYLNEKNNDIYSLPLDKLTTPYKPQKHRLLIYGYQVMYTDYSDKDEITHATKSKEFKKINDDLSSFSESADITSLVNTKANTTSSNPVSSGPYNINSPESSSSEPSLKDLAISAITNNGTLIEPVSSNQTPIKFFSNIALDATHSKIFKYDYQKGNWDSGTNFNGFNQNESGTYLYIVQYKYDNFLSINGASQSTFYHYQIFYFKVENTTPSVSVYDSNFNEVYSTGYTNKSVYLIDNSTTSPYDAKVQITLTAETFSGTKLFEKVPFASFENGSYNGIRYLKNETIPQEGTAILESVTGLHIDTSINTPYRNAKFTIEITSANSNNPSIRTFTIDTTEISNINARNVIYTSSSRYAIDTLVQNGLTNQPIIFSWNEKESRAATYGYYRYYPINELQYYGASASFLLYEMLDKHQTVPLDLKLDMTVNPIWTSYVNSRDSMQSIDASYVRSSAGLYVLEVYDQAGNSNFEVFLIDNSSPYFVEKKTDTSGSEERSILSSNITLPVSKNYSITIEWGSYKGIYVDYPNDDKELFTTYSYDNLDANEKEKLKTKLNNFFNSNLVHEYLDISTSGGINYNSKYLTIPISSKAFIKDTENSTYIEKTTNSYAIPFFRGQGEDEEAIEGSYKFLLRDQANVKESDNFYGFVNFPSAYLMISVSSDSSQMKVMYMKDGVENDLGFAGYSFNGNYYSYMQTVEGQDTSQKVYTKDSTKEGATITDRTYKYMYYTPTSTNETLYLSFIPVANDGSIVKNITLLYYPFVKKYKEVSGNSNGLGGNKTYYSYYYTLADDATEIPVFTYSPTQSYEVGKSQTFEISFAGTNTSAKPGKYVFVREYDTERSATAKFDFYERDLTLNIDRFNVISEQETVSYSVANTFVHNGTTYLTYFDPQDNSNYYKLNDVFYKLENQEMKGIGVTEEDKALIERLVASTTTKSSLESIIGSDIILSMYSNEGQSNIQVSFPNYNSDGLNSGSLYKKNSFDEAEIPTSFVLETNKLPLKLYIPKMKYTLDYNYNNAKNSYTANLNNLLSSYGNSELRKEKDGENDVFNVYVEGVKVKSFATEEDAKKYLNSTQIAEYQLYAEITLTRKDNSKVKYKTDGSYSDNYLNIFKVNSFDQTITSSDRPVLFTEPGNYVVTLKQASNQTKEEGFYKIYKFAFEIETPAPAFEVYNGDNQLVNASENTGIESYYINTKKLTFKWTDSTSNYIANIDKTKIQAKKFANNTSSSIGGEYLPAEYIKEENGSYFITFDFGNFWKNGNYIEVTMQFEGHNPLYYGTTTKRVYVDYTAPSENLLKLIDNSCKASIFTSEYLLKNSRNLFTADKALYSWGTNDTLATVLENTSYNYSIDSGILKYYSFLASDDFFTKLKESKDQTLSTEINEIYFKRIDNYKSYQQVTKDSFSVYNYTSIEQVEITNFENNTYYEIVEFDAAGNMTVYVVKYTQSALSNDSEALSYVNDIGQSVTLTNNDVTNKENIYSNSGFALTKLDYLQDNWGYYSVTLKTGMNSGFTKMYMLSPWLEDGLIYVLTIENSTFVYTPVRLSEVFASAENSSFKHSMNLSNRNTGENKTLLISIMDANLDITKSSNATTATLSITSPSEEEIKNTAKSYIFPVKVTIYQYDVAKSSWESLFEKEAPTGYPSEWINEASDITITYSLGKLNFAINLGAIPTNKFKYEIIDNFGNLTTVIQLPNEETCTEIVSKGSKYSFVEHDGSTTYLTDSEISYCYNYYIYTVKVQYLDKIDNTFIDSSLSSQLVPDTQSIYSYTFRPEYNKVNYDQVYKINIFESEDKNQTNPIKVINIRLYNRLPELSKEGTSITGQNSIWFKDKNNDTLADYGLTRNQTVSINGRTYQTDGYSLTTYSNNVTVFFDNGQQQSATGNFSYLNEYPYTVYFSSDEGETWTDINSSSNGYLVSGTGNYIFLVIYDNTDFLTDKCKIFNLTILNSSSIFYYITVDGLKITKNDMTFTDNDGQQYDENYIVSVKYSDKATRLKIYANNELNVTIGGDEPRPEKVVYTNTEVVTEIYHYQSTTSTGYFTISYIAENSAIVKYLVYDTYSGSHESLLETNSATIVANESESNFEKLKLTWTGYYGIQENRIKVQITKLFNGKFVPIELPIYKENTNNYVYITRAGSYQLRFIDSCSPANVQKFGSSSYLNLVFLNTVPFTVSYTDLQGENIVTEPINRATYNGEVKITPVDLTSYYTTSGYPVISVTRNGLDYKNYSLSNYVYTFKETGYYKVTFTAHDRVSGAVIRKQEYTFTIINEKESTYSYEFTPYAQYYIESVKRYSPKTNETTDITNDLIKILGGNTVKIEDKIYLKQLLISYYDEKTGDGHYILTVNSGDDGYGNLTANSFSFKFWINVAEPPITISLNEGGSTTDNITVSFNVQNFYDAIGDSYIQIGNTRYIFTQETLADYGENATLPPITEKGTYNIQVYTLSGNLLFSYKVTKTDPLNAWAIIAIVIAVLAVAAVTFITIKLRKRLKVK